MIKFLYIISLSFIFSSPVDFTVMVDREEIFKGEYIKLSFDVEIDKGYFIYSSDPEKSLSPTKVIWPDSTVFIDSSIVYEPPPKVKYDENFEMDVSYHTSSVQFNQYFLTSKDIEELDQINGKFFYQACDIKQCIRYYDDFSVKLKIKEGDPREEFSIIPHEINLISGSKDMLQDSIDSGLLSFVMLSFGMGLLALLTPCVFPMIPITVSFFTKQGERENNKPLRSAIIYALGIIVIFTSLGLILAVTLGASGANQIASNPWVNLFIALLFVFFAFSLFGMYEIQAPSVMRQFSLESEQKGGTVGILFMALTFTLTSFTCTVQFVGLLLVAASRGSYMWPILGMLIFSLAFSLPFFLLALFPQYLSKLPKSGQWMNSIKVTMGFLELGAAMKFFSNVDLVWGIGLFTYEFVLASWAIIAILTGIYLLGKIKLPHDSELQYIGVARMMISICFLTFGLYLTNGLWGGQIYGLVDSYLPPKIVNEQVLDSTKNSTKKNWIQNYEQGVKLSRQTGKPIFIDFTGYTCTNCRWMEVNVFVDTEVEKLFDEFILVKLFTDGGPNHKEYQQMEIDRYGTSALPFYVVLNPQEEEISRFHGMDPDVTKFINFLKFALNKFGVRYDT
tara:strand:- start:180 stop:2036 length:1857 start_codon:yes stop_codon:yes gene_type:complete